MRNLIRTILMGAASLPVLCGVSAFLSTPQMASAQVSGCTVASFNGSYASTSFGQALAGPAGAGPFASAGRWTFDGVGGVTVNDTINYNGNVQDRTLIGTYTVDPSTCRGLVTFQGASAGDQANIYPSATGNNASFVIRNPSTVVSAGTLMK